MPVNPKANNPIASKSGTLLQSVVQIFYKCSQRYWRHNKWQATLMLLGMALGVAVVFAVDIANDSAKKAFSLSLDAVTGRTTHQIIGGREGINESIYTELRTTLGFRNSAPVIESTLQLTANNGTSTLKTNVQLLGVDLFAEPMFRQTGSNSDRSSLDILQPFTVTLSSSVAQRLNVGVGDTVSIENKNTKLTVISTLDSQQQPGFENIALVDIATAQELLNLQGKITRIDLVIPDSQLINREEKPLDNSYQTTQSTNTTQQNIQYLQSELPGIHIVEAARRNNELTQMTAAFHTNLLAMSLLALLVGAFLIYNTVTLSVVQRRQSFGQLRTLGVTRQQLFWSIITETLLFAVIGTIAGVVIGYFLGNFLLTLVTRTINDLFFSVEVRNVAFSVVTLGKACLTGIAVSLLAALAPALEASTSPPSTVVQRTSVERKLSKLVPVVFGFGIILMVIGVAILWGSSKDLWAGFVAIFLIVLGYSLMIPQVLILITSFGSKKLSTTSVSTMGYYPLRSLSTNLSRTAVAITALAVSVSATAGVGIMIGSFRQSVDQWLKTSLQSDIYIRAIEENVLPADIASKITNIEGVTGTREARFTEVESESTSVRVMAVRNTGDAGHHYQFKHQQNTTPEPDGTAIVASLIGNNKIIISEPYANQSSISVNDTINLSTDQGLTPFTVTGIFTNYTTGRGLVVMDLDIYQQHWRDKNINSVGVHIDKNTAASVNQNLHTLLSNHDAQYLMRSNTDIHKNSLEIFDRTFAITHILRLLTIGVAFVGILSALMALSLERRKEYAVLRALGITPPELRKMMLFQTGLMGVFAGLLALPLGIVMSHILVSVINVRSFGWTMDFIIPAGVLLEGLVLAVIAALLAGIYPAIKLSRLSPAEALRDQ